VSGLWPPQAGLTPTAPLLERYSKRLSQLHHRSVRQRRKLAVPKEESDANGPSTSGRRRRSGAGASSRGFCRAVGGASTKRGILRVSQSLLAYDRTSTRVVVLPLYVLSYRPVRLLRFGRLGLLRLFYLLLYLPLLFLRRIFLRFPCARGQAANGGESGHEDEKGSEPASQASPSASQASPSLRWLCFPDPTLASDFLAFGVPVL
jgi:hypothetical protein